MKTLIEDKMIHVAGIFLSNLQGGAFEILDLF